MRDRMREAIHSGDAIKLNEAIENWLAGTLNDSELAERREILRNEPCLNLINRNASG